MLTVVQAAGYGISVVAAFTAAGMVVLVRTYVSENATDFSPSENQLRVLTAVQDADYGTSVLDLCRTAEIERTLPVSLIGPGSLAIPYMPGVLAERGRVLTDFKPTERQQKLLKVLQASGYGLTVVDACKQADVSPPWYGRHRLAPHRFALFAERAAAA